MNGTITTDEHERQKVAQLAEIKTRYKRGETAWHLNDIALLLSMVEADSAATVRAERNRLDHAD